MDEATFLKCVDRLLNEYSAASPLPRIKPPEIRLSVIPIQPSSEIPDDVEGAWPPFHRLEITWAEGSPYRVFGPILAVTHRRLLDVYAHLCMKLLSYNDKLLGSDAYVTRCLESFLSGGARATPENPPNVV
jgi:hypothetical protein